MVSRLEKNKKIEKEIKKEVKIEKKEKRKKRNRKFLAFIISLLIIFFIYSYFIEPNLLLVNEKVILSSNIKEDLHGIKIVHFSDLHYGSSINSKNIKKVITKINELKPDIVVFTGDLLDIRYTEKYTKKEIDVLTDALKDINALGVNIGPGSFTGIRAALAISKVISSQLNIPLVGVNSFEILSLLKTKNKKTIYPTCSVNAT